MLCQASQAKLYVNLLKVAWLKLRELYKSQILRCYYVVLHLHLNALIQQHQTLHIQLQVSPVLPAPKLQETDVLQVIWLKAAFGQ